MIRSTISPPTTTIAKGRCESSRSRAPRSRAGYQGRFPIVAGILDVQKSAMALNNGASGIFLKSEAPERLIHAIRRVANGEIWVDPK